MKLKNPDKHQTLSSNAKVDKIATDSLKNETDIELKNMNNEDYLRMSEHESIDPFVSASTIQTGIGIAGKILGTLGVPFPGQIASLYSFILGELWPKGKSQWEIFMEHVEAIINRKISTYARNKALTDLKGLGDALAVYHESLESWVGNRNNTRARSVVKNQYIALELMFVQKLPSFAVSGEEVPLLPIYAQAANLHLLLLRDASIFEKNGGLSASEISTFYNRQVERTRDYSYHCVKWNNTGLNNLRATNGQSWVRYNQFRKDIELMVLDLVRVFPSYDTLVYPIKTTSQLTREVYTDAIGTVDPNQALRSTTWYNNNAPSFSAIEAAVIRSPHLLDFLEKVTIYSLLSRWSNTQYMNMWGGHRLESRPIGGALNTSTQGSTNTSINPVTLQFTSRDFYRTESWAGLNLFLTQPVNGVPRVDFHWKFPTLPIASDNFYYLGYAGVGTQLQDSENELPPETTGQPNYESYSHRLSHIGLISGSHVKALVYSWTHRSADRTNTIEPNSITQIPLVKAFNLSSGAAVVRGPGFTGGHILRRTKSGTFGHIRVNINPPFAQRYRVRMSYASTTDLQFHTSINGKAINQGNFSATMNRGEDLDYKTFRTVGFTTPFSFSDVQSTFTIGAWNFSSGNEVYIGRIEFVPVEVTYEAEYDFEKAQEKVTALFTSTNPRGLKTDVKDYHIDQVSNLVESLSDELYLDEKRELFEIVKYAKQIHIERNM
uniref:Pesticidal crystal protein Cry1Ic n=1 Tax=Bacillus thuringiensis TaxID=1428 RepID=CR1IC_BACTU|nr:RecName: Full=Pesticidal crystal protein Cry1Ic; AltName: Full=81 kDa crystal protein; AltName: Full=Crystaline entomocidal protoxin; AltName: Full=Insecticidal delta-endotoxin CryII(c) [Bacillus thuringiensis]AAC62933.1 crystal protein toxin [Bacillus thuringiensis]